MAHEMPCKIKFYLMSLSYHIQLEFIGVTCCLCARARARAYSPRFKANKLHVTVSPMPVESTFVWYWARIENSTTESTAACQFQPIQHFESYYAEHEMRDRQQWEMRMRNSDTIYLINWCCKRMSAAAVYRSGSRIWKSVKTLATAFQNDCSNHHVI